MIRRAALSALVFGIAAACGGSDDETPPPGVDTPDGGPITPNPGGEGPPPPAPPLPGTPITGVFVSSSKGIVDGDGAMSRPLKTLAAAMALAKTKNQAVIACAETFAEAVTLVDGVTLYGYFDCTAPEWKRVDGVHAIIASPTSPAVLADGLKLQARFEGFDILGPDIAGVAAAAVPAASSYGMVVKSSKGLALTDVTIRAGKGQDGADGVEPAQGNSDPSPTKTGKPAIMAVTQTCSMFANCALFSTVAGPAGGTSQCSPAAGGPGGPGGQGGDGVQANDGYYNKDDAYRAAQAPGRPYQASASTAQGGAVQVLGEFGGANGTAGAAGANGTTDPWSFSADGSFKPGVGKPGLIGSPGQGGGGGAGTNIWWTDYGASATTPPLSGWSQGATGGGGGAGGCAGLPGSGGTGGGASVGLLVIASEMTIAKSHIEGKKGGRAGKGALGTLGTPGNLGGRGGNPTQTELVAGIAPGRYGARGGNGGDGGPAGLSGHGAPGPSIALVFNGTRPTTTAVDLIPGLAGEGFGPITRGSQSLPAITGEAIPERQF